MYEILKTRLCQKKVADFLGLNAILLSEVYMASLNNRVLFSISIMILLWFQISIYCNIIHDHLFTTCEKLIQNDLKF